MSTHLDPRLQPGQQSQPQFPPQGFTGQQVAHHLAPENVPAPAVQQQWLPGVPTDPGVTLDPDVDETGYGDYFGSDIRYEYMMPDGKMYITFKKMNEGDISRYNKILNRDVTVEKGTGNARIRINQVEERHALLQVAVTGWHMLRRNSQGRWIEVPFSNGSPGSTFMQWVMVADPEIIADLEKTVRDKNPSLLPANTETVEAIDKQISELEEQKVRVLERMRGEGVSATS